MRTKAPTELVLIQEISTFWSKAARGGPLAGARNSVPECLDLPSTMPGLPPRRYQPPTVQPDPYSAHGPGTIPIFYHYVAYGEMDQFKTPQAQYWLRLACRLPEPTTISLWGQVPPLNLAKTEDTLVVEIPWEHIPGKPQRYRSPGGFTLKIDCWGQVRYNVRLAYDEGGWYYEKYVLNISYAALPAPTFFSRTAPVQVLLDMADLLW